MRVLILASLVVVAAGSYWPWDPRSGNNKQGIDRNPGPSFSPEPSSDSMFSSLNHPLTSAQADVNEIKRLLIDVERKMQNFCRKHTDRPLGEAYGSKYYRVYANMTGCREDGLEVRAGQRLVAIQAKDSHCDYIALRQLPDAVDSNSAFWRFESGQLNIMFPYQSARRRCGRVISDSVHSLPKFDDDTQDPDFEVRLGDAELGSALRMYSSEHVKQSSSKDDWDD